MLLSVEQDPRRGGGEGCYEQGLSISCVDLAIWVSLTSDCILLKCDKVEIWHYSTGRNDWAWAIKHSLLWLFEIRHEQRILKAYRNSNKDSFYELYLTLSLPEFINFLSYFCIQNVMFISSALKQRIYDHKLVDKTLLGQNCTMKSCERKTYIWSNIHEFKITHRLTF